MSLANRLIVGLCASCLLVGVSIDIGAKLARDQIARTCLPQPGERLVSTTQRADGVSCTYTLAPAYGLAKRTRRATCS